MESSIVIELIQNIALLLSFSLLYELVWWNDKRYRKFFFRFLSGLITGGIGILLMKTPWFAIPGISFDSRTILILNTSLFFGPLASVVAMAVLVAFRIYMAGAGLAMGILTIVTAGTIGLLWSRKFPDWKKGKVNIKLWSVAVLVHIVALFCTLALPKEQIIPTLKAVIIPMLLIYPLASLLLGKVLVRRMNTWKSHEAISLAEERLKRFVNSNTDLMFIKDDQFRYIVFNEATVRFFNRDREDILNHTDYELLERKYADFCRKSDLAALSGEGNSVTEESIGNKIYEVTKFPINIGNDNNGIGCIMKDISATLKNRELQKALLEISQLPFENITLRDFLFDIHKQLSRVIKSGNIYIALYHPEDNTYSFPYYIDDYDNFESDERVNMDNSLTDYIRITGKGALIRSKDEEEINKNYLLNFQGEYSPVWMGAPLMGGGGKTVIGVIAVQDYQDENAYSEEDLITLELFANRVGVFIERAAYIKELQEAKELAEKNDRLKTAFLANISHEIRTPMNAIIGFSDILMEEVADPGQKNYISIINNSAYRLLSTVNDVIDIAKIEAGETSLIIEPFNVYEVLRTLYKFFHRPANTIDIKISTPLYDTGQILNDTDSKLFLEIKTDKTKFIQIFTNLISNAVKFTEHGLIEFGFYRENGENPGNGKIIYFVRDTGKGIDTDDIDNIFKRFYQARYNKTGYHEGTGLGLTIVKEYLTLMGGEIWVKSSPGVGSTFFFTLELPNLGNHAAAGLQ